MKRAAPDVDEEAAEDHQWEGGGAQESEAHVDAGGDAGQQVTCNPPDKT